jgi:uncharacterized membrane protein YphA (DoxX/SURF4 family)
MRRRDLITLIAGAVAWPIVSRAQSPHRIPRIAVLWHAADAEERDQEGILAAAIPGDLLVDADAIARKSRTEESKLFGSSGKHVKSRLMVRASRAEYAKGASLCPILIQAKGPTNSLPTKYLEQRSLGGRARFDRSDISALRNFQTYGACLHGRLHRLCWPPLLWFGYAIAVAAEIGGRLALVVTYQTRIAATVLATFSITTALAFHNQLADHQFIQFFKNVSMAGRLLQVVAFGAGRFSSDGRRG